MSRILRALERVLVAPERDRPSWLARPIYWVGDGVQPAPLPAHITAAQIHAALATIPNQGPR